jgi:hypothetical protein
MMLLKCDECGRAKEVENPLCITCHEYEEEDNYCFFYETRMTDRDPKTYHCYGYTNECRCGGRMEKIDEPFPEETEEQPEITPEAIEKPKKTFWDRFKWKK